MKRKLFGESHFGSCQSDRTPTLHVPQIVNEAQCPGNYLKITIFHIT